MRHIIIFAFIVLGGISCDTEDNLEDNFESTFVKYYGGEGNQFGVDIGFLDDGGFILLGNSINPDGNSQIYLVRTDNLGNELWSKTYGGSADEVAIDLEINQQQELFIAASVTEIGLPDSSKSFIMKTDVDGNELANITLGSSTFIYDLSDIIIDQNQELVTIGTIEKKDTDRMGNPIVYEDVLLYWLDSDLNVLVTRSNTNTPRTFDNRGQRLIEKPNGDLLCFSSNSSPLADTEGFNFYVFGASSQRGIETAGARFYGTDENQFISGVSMASDGNIVMIGNTISENGIQRLFIASTASDLDPVFIINSLTIQSTEGIDVWNSVFGGILIVGNQRAGTTNDIFLAKLDDAGNLLWSKTFGGFDDDCVASVKELSDGSIIFVASIELESQQKMALLKLNRDGDFSD